MLSEQGMLAFSQPASSERVTTYDQAILAFKSETILMTFQRILRQFASFAASLLDMNHELVPALLTTTVEERDGEKGAETILSNTSMHIVLPGMGLREAEFNSRRIGKTTITTSSKSRRGAYTHTHVAST